MNIGFSQTQVADTIVYDAAENDAEFLGGSGGVGVWISSNFELPTEISKSEQGKIYLSFVVEKDGSVSNVKIVKGLSEKLNKAAISAVNKMPKWKPAMNNGKAVRSRFTLPIQISIN